MRTYAKAHTQGLQGRLRDDANVVATAKHFLGDGGTENGKDQGLTVTTMPTLINLHGQGYYGAIDAGAQTVMASYNSWKDADGGIDHGKMHGNRELLTDALKDKMGFDGFIVSDWNAIGQLPGCSNSSCAAAINAGIDMMMVPDDWKAFIDNTIQQVEAGEIPMSRIDDAVTRILRVKLRAGLFDGRKPSAATAMPGARTHPGPRPGTAGGARVAGAAQERPRRAAAAARPEGAGGRRERRQHVQPDRRLVADLARHREQQCRLSRTPIRSSTASARRWARQA